MKASILLELDPLDYFKKIVMQEGCAHTLLDLLWMYVGFTLLLFLLLHYMQLIADNSILIEFFIYL